MNPLVSVIIPIYNAEKYLDKTLTSLVNQTLAEIEILCINDGSQDNSLAKLQEYQKKDKRISIINKTNEGVWKARLDGIKQAKSPYVAFVDSDDQVAENFVEELYRKICQEEADIAICGYQRIDNETGKVISQEMKWPENKIIEQEKNPEEVISINTAVWNKLFKKSVIQKIPELENPPRILEDMMFLALVYRNVKKICFVEQYLYDYQVISGSAMKRYHEQEIQSIQKAMLEVKQQYEKNKATQQQREILAAMAFLHLGISLMFLIAEAKSFDFKEEYKQNLAYLNEHFPEWKKTKYLTLHYVITHHFVNLKVTIMKKIYDIHSFRLAAIGYGKLKINLKW